MKRTLCVPIIVVLAASPARPDDHEAFDIGRLDARLRVDAPAVVREDLTTFEVTSPDEAEETHVVAYTVFRKEGRGFGEIELPYDRFSSIDELEGALYDEHGKEIRTLASGDVKDESNIAAHALYEDARVRKAELYYDRYPYTVTFSYRIEHTGLINYPAWYAQGSREPVEHTRFEAIIPSSQELRYWTSEDSLKPRVTVADGRRHYVWEASGLRELTEDELDEDIEKRSPVARIAPTDYELGGHAGSMKDWESFGAWCAALWQGKTQLPPEALHDVDSLVAGLANPGDKARRLYRYMQGKTRYVNVSLGIGGFEPFDATYVDQRGYGDCKALSNYMIALLARAGIKALPVLVDAGGLRSTTIESFPENRFDHVIVCIPLERDSVWLECTSQISPYGFLGEFTENRPALLITPEGGVLVRTPSSGSGENVARTKGRVVLTGPGDARGELSVSRTGNFADDVRSVMTYDHLRDRELWLLRLLDVSGTSLLSYEVKGVEEHADRVRFSMNVEMPRFAASSGSRLFFMPDLTHRTSTPPRDRKDRKSPVRYSTAFVSTDSTTFVLPGGYRCEALPAAVALDASFGSYRSSTTALGDTALVHTRRLEIRSAVIPAEHYGEYVTFMRGVVKADKAQVVAVRKN